jgi:hypothetical protein
MKHRISVLNNHISVSSFQGSELLCHCIFCGGAGGMVARLIYKTENFSL